MRYLHLTVEQFNLLANPENADIVTLGAKKDILNPQFSTANWAVSGLRLYKPEDIMNNANGHTEKMNQR
jgi:hypothetical protein